MKKLFVIGLLAAALIIPATVAVVGAEAPPKELAMRPPESNEVAGESQQVNWGLLWYNTINPCRVFDARNYPPKSQWYGEYIFNLQFNCPAIPTYAKAVMINVAATESTGPGNIRGYAAYDSTPNTAMLNYGIIPGLNAIGNTAAIPLCGGCGYDLALYISRTTYFIIDAFGYYD